MMSAVVYLTLGALPRAAVARPLVKLYILAVACLLTGLVGGEPRLLGCSLSDRRVGGLARRAGLGHALLADGAMVAKARASGGRRRRQVDPLTRCSDLGYRRSQE